MRIRDHLVPLVCAGAALGFVTLASCSNTETPRAAPGATAPTAGALVTTPTTTTPPATTPGSAGAVSLAVAQTGLGTVVVGRAGRTLYLFDKDSAKPPKSTCVGACATAWPPLTGDPTAVSAPGIDASLIGGVARADGSTQLTLNGWPLYYFAGDARAGDTNGEGVQNVWHAVAPNGTPAAGGGGYGGY